MASNSPQSPSGGSGSKGSPVDLTKILSGIDFPADKKKIEQYAEQNQSKVQSARDILDAIHRLPDRQYQSMADVEKNFRQHP